MEEMLLVDEPGARFSPVEGEEPVAVEKAPDLDAEIADAESRAVLPLSALGTRVVPIETSGAKREAWLLKVPLVFSDLVESTATGASIGSIRHVDGAEDVESSTTGKAIRPGSLTKRRKVRMTFEVDAGLVASLPDDMKKVTPVRYEVSLDPAEDSASSAGSRGGALAVAFTPGAGFTVLGGVLRNGTLTAGASDPAYLAHVARRRQREKDLGVRAPAQIDDDDTDALLHIQGSGAASAAARAAAAVAAIRHPPQPLGSARGGAARSAPRSVYALFEERAYWTFKEAVEATGQKEVRNPNLRLVEQCCYAKGTFRYISRSRAIFWVPGGSSKRATRSMRVHAQWPAPGLVSSEAGVSLDSERTS
jgi:hypothetical protein